MVPPEIPGYYDNLGNSAAGWGQPTLNFYVYFSGYGNGVFDANDVNFLNRAGRQFAGPDRADISARGSQLPIAVTEPILRHAYRQ